MDAPEKKKEVQFAPEPIILPPVEVVIFTNFLLSSELKKALHELDSNGISTALQEPGAVRSTNSKNPTKDELDVLQTNIKMFHPPPLNSFRRKDLIRIMKKHDFVLEADLPDRICFGYCRNCLHRMMSSQGPSS